MIPNFSIDFYLQVDTTFCFRQEKRHPTGSCKSNLLEILLRKNAVKVPYMILSSGLDLGRKSAIGFLPWHFDR